MLKVALGAAAGVLVAGLLQRGAGHKPRHHASRNKERRHVPRTSSARQQRRNDRSSGAAAAAAAPAPAQASPADLWYSAVPRGGIYLLLLLQALASAAAVVWAQPLRPHNIAANDWQHLVSLLACSAMVLSLAGAWRHYQQQAAAGIGGMPDWLKPAAAQQQRGLLGQQQQRQQQQQQQQAAAPPQDLSGVYIKDKAASDSLDEACDVMRLGGLVRMAIGLIKGVELRQDNDMFTFVLHSGILWFKVTECYSQDGRAARFKRRDLRSGTHVGRVQRCPATGGWLLRVEWGEPYGGQGCDHFYLAAKDVLHVDTTLTVGDRTIQYRQVYRRKQ